ncbi:MAG: phosphonate ABC transporter, permease protein PhnE [Deltaproteobacteria bacterium]|nr:phosphonate ABC transporter, permease protein PhnE [Deltaproteobacteria bacterium]
MKNLTSTHMSEAFVHFIQAEQALRSSRRLQTTLFTMLFFGALIGAVIVGEVRIDTFIEGLPSFFNYISATLPEIHSSTFLTDIKEWYWGLGRWLWMLLDTITIAFLATIIGSISAFILCFPASHNLMRNPFIYHIARRSMEIFRAVPEIVYALIFVFSFGLGPFPGVLAIAIHSTGSLGKLFSEVNENIDHQPLEGIRASGGNWFQVIRYGVIPQVLPNILSYTLLRFEINIRAASVVGFVGAGGIGQELMFVIRQFIYVDISAIVLLIMIMVTIIDMTCEKLRHYAIGKEALF